MILRATLTILFLLPLAVSQTRAAARQPNVVVFIADDLGWRDLSYRGSTFYETPNIDALAARGTTFANAYSACPVCSPTRASLITGKYPQRVRVTDYIGGPQPDVAATQPRFRDRAMLPAPYETQLALDETTIAETMKANGYATYFTGKWHLGGPKFFPDKQGFDTSVAAAGGVGKTGFLLPDGQHVDVKIATDAAKWISQQKPDKPFLVWFCLFDPHVPLQAPPDTIKYFEEKKAKLKLEDTFEDEGKSKVRTTQCHPTYAAMLKKMDDAVGIVTKQIHDQGLENDTIIIFTSDNGGLATAEGAPTSNLPSRAGKGWAYEGGIRVPLIMLIPGMTKPGSTTDQRAISMDLSATIQAACGVANPTAPDGLSLLPALKGEPLPVRSLYWHYPHYGNQGGQPFSAIRSGDYKLIVFHDPQHAPELYDITLDPSEKNNIAKKDPATVEGLRVLLDAWKKDVGAIDATPKVARFAP